MPALRRLRSIAGRAKRFALAYVRPRLSALRSFLLRTTVVADRRDIYSATKTTRACGLTVRQSRFPRGHVRVALLVDEFFGGWDTAIGGYGALARKYVCKFVPSDSIHVDVLLNIGADNRVHSRTVDGTTLYRLPLDPTIRQRWLDSQGYSLFLTIEMTEPSFQIIKTFRSAVPILYWIQDPRDLGMYQPRSRSVVKLQDDDWSYLRDVQSWIGDQVDSGRVTFISQGHSLSDIARRMYRLPVTTPITDLPNPVDIDLGYTLDVPPRENVVVFLARLEAQKRAWMFCELAKRMPQYQFLVLGSTGVGRNEAGNARSLAAYRNPDGSSRVANLRFCGHVDGDEKYGLLRRAKVLVNTSVWEGIPVSWLEALSFGVPIVAAFDRDDIVARFGSFVGEISGDGTDDASQQLLVDAVEFWMTHDDERATVGRAAMAFIRSRHSIAAFQEHMRRSILEAAR